MNIEPKKSSAVGTAFIFVTFSLYLLYNTLFKGCNHVPKTEPQEIKKDDTVRIKQDIGGVLICSPVFHSSNWDFEVYYYYEVNGNRVNIGTGYYSGRWWDNKVQLKKYREWIMLKTAASYGIDKIIVGDTSLSVWKEYALVPNGTNEDKYGNKIPAHSYESHIDSIKADSIFLHYKKEFGPENIFTNHKREVLYIFDEETGEPQLVGMKK